MSDGIYPTLSNAEVQSLIATVDAMEPVT